MTTKIQDNAIDKLTELTLRLSNSSRSKQSNEEKKELFLEIASEANELVNEVLSNSVNPIRSKPEYIPLPFSDVLIQIIRPIREAEETFQSDKKVSEELIRAIEEFVHIVESDARMLQTSPPNIASNYNERDIHFIESRLAAIVTSCDDAIIGKDLKGVIHTWNQGAEKLFGYKFSEVAGKQVAFLMPSDAKEDMEHILRMLNEGKKVQNFETVRISKDGTRIDVLVTVSPIRDANGIVTGGSTVVKDISERKRLEKQLETINDELELKISERTRKLKAANSDLENFAKIAAHDLKEPLSTIKGCTKLVYSKCASKMNPDEIHILDYLIEAGDRMSQLIDDILSHSKITQSIEKQDLVSCSELLDTVKSDLRKQIYDSKATIIVKGEKLPHVRGHQPQLKTVLQNIISNAIKYRSKKPLEIIVSVEDKIISPTTDQWWISVQDNGIGISPEYHQSIFKMFTRLHSRSEYSGTGIGLAICKKIVSEHGGQIWVESEAEKGSTFTFSLPHFD